MPSRKRIRFESLERRVLLANDLTDGLLHYWKFDETSGDLAADSVGENPIELSNWSDGEPQWTEGKVGGALDFSSETDNFAITQSDVDLDKFSISFWLNLTGREGINPRLIAPLQAEGHHPGVVISQEFGKGVGTYYDHGRSSAQDPNPVALAKWDHYVFTYDKDGKTIVYRNGSQVAEDNSRAGAVGGRWVLGHNGDPNNAKDSLNGLMDEVRLYGRVLSPQEAATLAAPVDVDAGSDQQSNEGQTVSLPNATFQFDGSLSELSGTVDWGDGTSEPAVLSVVNGTNRITNTHQYTDNGTFTVKVTMEASGLTGDDSISVQVGNLPPTTSPPAQVTGVMNREVRFTIPFSDPGSADEHQVTIDWGDGSQSNAQVQVLNGIKTAIATHQYTESAKFELRATIADDDGATTPVSTTAHIAKTLWQNPIQPLDAVSNRVISSSDAVAILNELNAKQFHDAGSPVLNPPPEGIAPIYFDVSGDGVISPIDVLLVINFLNANGTVQAEGESSDSQPKICTPDENGQLTAPILLPEQVVESKLLWEQVVESQPLWEKADSHRENVDLSFFVGVEHETAKVW